MAPDHDQSPAVPEAPPTGGSVVKTPDGETPYKVVLEHESGADTEQPVSSIREGEDLIKKATPPPPKDPEAGSWNP